MSRSLTWLCALLLALAPGCGLTLDLAPEEDAGALLRDGGPDPAPEGGPGTDGAAPRVDAASPADGGPAGLDGRTCVDADGDGVTDCTDCDDADPTVYPGAPPVCGDGVANDCSSRGEDALCGGLGTFVSERGDDANPGTRALPLRTVGQGLANAAAIGGGVDVYVAEGFYAEDVVLLEGASLLGGYEDATWTRDPTAHATVLQAESAVGLRAPNGITRATEVSGFVLRGHDAHVASAVTIASGAAPLFRGTLVYAPNATGRSHAVVVNPTGATHAARPRFERCRLKLGASAPGWGLEQGSYGLLSRATAVEVVDSEIELASAGTVQFGAALFGSPAGARIARSRVRGGSGALVSFGVRVVGGHAALDRLAVNPGSCAELCFGVELTGDLRTVSLTNSILFAGAEARVGSAGLSLVFERVPSSSPDVLVHSSFLSGGTAPLGAPTAGVFLANEAPDASLAVGRFFNNAIRSGNAGERAAFVEAGPSIDPRRFEHNALWFDGSIVSGALRLYVDEGSDVRSGAALVNGLPEARNNLASDCGLAGAPGSDFRLPAGSPCTDTGSSEELPAQDFEGDARPQGSGPDIGVDEVRGP